MATANKSEQIFVGVNNERIELTGSDKEAFIAQRLADQEAHALLEAEYQAKRDARESAITKLGEIAGLTKEELDAIL
jgi:DnaJ-domain-containing protein 1